MRSYFLFTLLLIACASKELPSFIEKCALTDLVQTEECIIDRVNKLKPQLQNGIPELKLPPIEPFHLPKFIIETGTGSNVALRAEINDMTINGLKDIEVIKFIWGISEGFMQFQFKVPFLKCVGGYDVKGKVLLFDLQSKGTFAANISDVLAETKAKVSTYKKDGKEYVIISEDDISVQNSFGSAKIHFDKLFANEEINNQVNSVINENIVDLSKEVAPLLHTAIHKLVTGILNPLLKEYSLEELFV